MDCSLCSLVRLAFDKLKALFLNLSNASNKYRRHALTSSRSRTVYSSNLSGRQAGGESKSLKGKLLNGFKSMQNGKKWYIIVNPAAGNGAGRRIWPILEKQVKKRLPNCEVIHTAYATHAIQIVDNAIKNGFRHFIAVGGDGTNHEVANGILQQKTIDSSAITYALLPVGTGNDWIKTYGIPKKINLWLDMLCAENTRIQDVGFLEYKFEGNHKTRYFVNVAGLAYDAFVVRYIEKNKKKVRNQFFYLMMIMRCLFKYALRKARVKFDNKEEEGLFYTINIGICKYSGGGMSLVPHATPDDGQLALTLAGKVSKLSILLNTWRFYNESILQHSKIKGYQTQEINISAVEKDQPVLLEADGEFLGETPVRITIIKEALKVVVP